MWRHRYINPDRNDYIQIPKQQWGLKNNNSIKKFGKSSQFRFWILMIKMWRSLVKANTPGRWPCQEKSLRRRERVQNLKLKPKEKRENKKGTLKWESVHWIDLFKTKKKVVNGLNAGGFTCIFNCHQETPSTKRIIYRYCDPIENSRHESMFDRCPHRDRSMNDVRIMSGNHASR